MYRAAARTIVAGLYVGGYLCFICGIVQVIEAVKADPVHTWGVAWGIGRIMVAGLVGWLSAFICCGLGYACVKSA